MANEIQVQSLLQIKSGFQEYLSRPGAFTADMLGVVGPTPGAFTASKYGTVVDLSQIVYPGGMCEITNLDPDNYVTYGPYDVDAGTGTFRALGELLPGESFVFRLSRMLGKELGTGSGTTYVDSGLYLMVKADTAPCVVRVNAFDA